MDCSVKRGGLLPERGRPARHVSPAEVKALFGRFAPLVLRRVSVADDREDATRAGVRIARTTGDKTSHFRTALLAGCGHESSRFLLDNPALASQPNQQCTPCPVSPSIRGCCPVQHEREHSTMDSLPQIPPCRRVADFAPQSESTPGRGSNLTDK